jgi:hypothetical protein
LIRNAVAASALACMLAPFALAQEAPPKDAYVTALGAIEKEIEQAKKASAGNPDIQITGHIIADRKAHKVTILGCASGIGQTEACEFFMTPNTSGKDYESLSVVWVKPSDVHQALEFIGLKAGRPVNYETNYQWSRGPRVIMSMVVGGQTIRAEDMIFDEEAKTTLPRMGLIFAGSTTMTDEKGVKHYGADEIDSKSIAPDYNDPVAVLDLPRRVSQGAVYGFQRPNAKYVMKQGTPVKITLEPAKGDEVVESRDLKIDAAIKNGQVLYTVSEGGKQLNESPTLPHLVAGLAEQAKSKADLFTVVSIDRTMKVQDVRKLYALLMSLEQDRGVKLDPPADGELFHRAFFPDEEWRNREERLGEPWELFLGRSNDKVTGRLERLVENFEPDAEAKTTLQKFETATPAEFVKTVNANPSQWTKAIFIYPPDDLTYGELMEWARPALPTYSRIFVFPPPKNAAATQPAATQPGATDGAAQPATQPAAK